MWDDVPCPKCKQRIVWSGGRWFCPSCHYGSSEPLEAPDLARIAKSTIGRGAEAAVAQLEDQRLLAEIAQDAASSDASREAAKKLEDQTLLAEIAMGLGEPRDFWDSYRPDPRAIAIDKLQNQTLLAKVARTAPIWEARLAAVRRLHRQFTLWRVARTDAEARVREGAGAQLRGLFLLLHRVAGWVRPSPERREERRKKREAERQSRQLIAKCRAQGGHYFTAQAMGLLHCVNCGHNVSREKAGPLRSIHWEGTPMSGERPLWNKTYLTDR